MTTDVDTPGPGPAPAPAPGARSHGRVWWRGLREILLIVALWLAYSAGRNLADQDEDAARDRARTILDVERWLHLDFERWVNLHVSHLTWLAVGMCFWYAALHYLVTPLVLAYTYIRHRSDYARVRNALVIASMVALIVYIFLPTMPPRLMPASYGYIDTMAQTADAGYGWWSAHASAPAGMSKFTNELAAMPSLHVGWTVWVAWVLRRRGNRLGICFGYLYVFGTTAVVLCTANHWLLDVVAGIALVLASIWLVDHVSALQREDGILRLLGRRDPAPHPDASPPGLG